MINIKLVARKFLLLSLTASLAMSSAMPAWAATSPGRHGVCRAFFEGLTIDQRTKLYEEYAAEMQGNDAVIKEVQRLKKEILVMEKKTGRFETPSDYALKMSLATFHLLIVTGDVEVASKEFSPLFEFAEGAFLMVRMKRDIIAKLQDDVANHRLDPKVGQTLIDQFKLEEQLAFSSYWENREEFFPVRMDLDRTLEQQKIQDPKAIMNETKVQLVQVDNSIQGAQTALSLPSPTSGYAPAPAPVAPPAPATPVTPAAPAAPTAPGAPLVPGHPLLPGGPVIHPAVAADADDDAAYEANTNAALIFNGFTHLIPGSVQANHPAPVPLADAQIAQAPLAPAPAPVAPLIVPVTPGAPVVPVAPVGPVIPAKAMDQTLALNTARQVDILVGHYMEKSYFQDAFKTARKFLGDDYKIARPTLDEMFTFDREHSNTNEVILARLNKHLNELHKLWSLMKFNLPQAFEILESAVASLPAPLVHPISRALMIPHDNSVRRLFMRPILEVMSVPFEGAGVDHLTRVEKLFDLNVRYPGDQLIVAYARMVRGTRSWTAMKSALIAEAYDKPFGANQQEVQKKYANMVKRMTAAEERADTLGDLSLTETVAPNYALFTSVYAAGVTSSWLFWNHQQWLPWFDALMAHLH